MKNSKDKYLIYDFTKITQMTAIHKYIIFFV